MNWFYDVFNLSMEAPGEELSEINFIVPKIEDYDESFSEEDEEEVCAASLWENIRKKKQREGKNYRPAKPGDKDRPDKDAFKKAQSSENEMAIEQITKMHDQLMEVVALIKTSSMPIKFQDWTKDMISKAETHIQNIFDFVKYYEPGKYEDEEDKSYAAEYQGKKVKLNKPFRTPGGPKKSAVYTKNESGKVVIVRFGDPNMSIKKSDPERRKSFRARHKCENPGPKWKAKYWSCKAW